MKSGSLMQKEARERVSTCVRGWGAVYKGVYLLLFMALLSIVAYAPAWATAKGEKTKAYILNTGMLAPYTTDDRRGFLDLLIKEAFRRIGLKANVAVYAASKRALINANDDLDQGVAMRVKGVQRQYPNLIRIPQRVLQVDFVAFTRGLDVATRGWSSLLPYSVAYIHGWVIFERNLLPHQASAAVKEPKQLFSMLKKDRVDMVLYERWQGVRQARRLGMKVAVLSPPLARADMYMYIHKKYARLVGPLDRALKAMKADGTYRTIFNETIGTFKTGAQVLGK